MNYDYQIGLLRKNLNELKAQPNNQQLSIWIYYTLPIVEEIFGVESRQYLKFKKVKLLYLEEKVKRNKDLYEIFNFMALFLTEEMIEVLNIRKNNELKTIEPKATVHHKKKWFVINIHSDSINLSWEVLLILIGAICSLAFYLGTLKTDIDKNNLIDVNRSYNTKIESLEGRIQKDSVQLQHFKDLQNNKKH